MNYSHEEYSRLVRRITDFTDRYQQVGLDHYKELHDYGTGELYTSTEVHMVTRIEENPGITAVKIAEITFRTKSAVSQMLSKLETKGLIRKEKDPDNGKQQLLFVTPKGKHLSLCHKAYDEALMGAPIQEVTEKFGREAIERFLDISEYIHKNYMHSKRK